MRARVCAFVLLLKSDPKTLVRVGFAFSFDGIKMNQFFSLSALFCMDYALFSFGGKTLTTENKKHLFLLSIKHTHIKSTFIQRQHEEEEENNNTG